MARKTKPPEVVPAGPLPDAEGGIVTAPPVFVQAEELPLPASLVCMSDKDIERATDLVDRHVPEFDDEDDEAAAIMNDPLVIAAKSGDRRLLLEALRDRLAVALVTTVSGRDIAAIARNLNLVSKELAGIPDPDAEGDDVDQLADKVKAMQQ